MQMARMVPIFPYQLTHHPCSMPPDNTCVCGWKGKENASTRALTIHVKACRVMASAVASKQSKRVAAEIDMGDLGDELSPVEPPRKTPRRSVSQSVVDSCTAY